MKRGPIIALVVLLLVAAVVVTGLGSWEKLWVEWAYNREIASETWDGPGPAAAHVGGPVGFEIDQEFADVFADEAFDASGEPEPAGWVRWHSVTVLRKRYSWLPGHEFLIPDQICPCCIWDDHHTCFRSQPEAGCALDDGNEIDFPSSFRCTCTDPSHDRD